MSDMVKRGEEGRGGAAHFIRAKGRDVMGEHRGAAGAWEPKGDGEREGAKGSTKAYEGMG